MSFSQLSQVARLAVILQAIWFLGHDQAVACATVSDETFPSENFVTAERAVIIWDQAHHIEHFIRQATILTQSPDIGFLVPTPHTPELAEVDPSIFDMAAFLGQPTRIPPTNYRSPWTIVSPLVTSSLLHLEWLSPRSLLSGINELRSARVLPTVLSEHDVAGYHATSLAADDEQTLSAWLAANGYLSTPELKAWLQPYIAAKWTITAFKLIKPDDNAPAIMTRAVRLSFQTDRPFYPYSEPSDRQQASATSPQGRALQLAILSNQRMTGALANNKPWPEKLEFAGPSTPPPSTSSWTIKQWLRFARLDDASHNTVLPATLTTFIDESNPRPGTADIYFSPDRDQASFQGSVVDFTLEPQNRFVFNHSFEDVAALLTLIILPAVPLYCGWKVLNLIPEKELNPSKVRRIQPISSHPQITIPRKRWIRLADRLVGALAIALGVYYGTQFAMLLADEIASAFLGWSDLSGHWIWIFLGLLLAMIPVVAMSCGVIFCGVTVWCNRPPGAQHRSTDLYSPQGARQGFMGISSMLAGWVALLLVVSVLVSLL